MNGEDISGPPGPQLRMYTHQPMLRSDLTSIDVVIEGLGEIDARLRTVGMWVDKTGSSRSVPASQRAYRRGVVYYLRGDKIVGILLWNTTDLLERAREVIRQQPKIASMSRLKGQIPLAPDDWLRIEETPGKVSSTSSIVRPFAYRRQHSPVSCAL
jgi:programmed cell death 8 (apoptosis-inducing factor)